VTRWAVAWAAALAVSACGSGSKVIERSAPERPRWVESAPASQDQLYFVGTCTDLPSYQEALRCARAEALTDVATWVGTRVSSQVYSASSEITRSSGTAVYFDSDVFLADARRSDTYHEVRDEDWGRSYRVSVLLTYPRREAEAERSRIEQTTERADRLVEEAPASLAALTGEGRWGDAVDRLVGIAREVAVPRNLNRSQHTERLAGLAEDLVTALQLSGQVAGRGVEVEARFAGGPAAGVPIECAVGSSKVAAETGSDGRAVCGAELELASESNRVTVRPDISAYLASIPSEASAVTVALGGLLDVSLQLQTGEPLDIAVSLKGDRGCEIALNALRERLRSAGIRFAADIEPRLALECEVKDEGRAGDLYTAWAQGVLMLFGYGMSVENSLSQVRGLGATPDAARDEALQRLGAGLSDPALKLLRTLSLEGGM
jgi:hypothetical protein